MTDDRLQHKIGETFEYDGFMLTCVDSPLSNACGELRCDGCFFGYRDEYEFSPMPYNCSDIVVCCGFERKDRSYVHYIEAK